MSTTKPRLSVTLDQDSYDVLTILSELQQRPLSAVVRYVLSLCTPSLQRLVDELGTLAYVERTTTAELQSVLNGSMLKTFI